MKADSLHDSFGEKLKSNSEIVDFKKFSDICFLSRKYIKCVHLEAGDFYDFDSEVRSRQTKAGARIPLLENYS